MRKGIILGIGILVILLALAGTGSAKSGFTSGVVSCTYCHNPCCTSNAEGDQYKLIHKFDGSAYPTTSVSCSNCHTNMTTTFFPLTSNGSSYNSTHRYNATTLASVKLISTTNGCNNCHNDTAGGSFILVTGAGTSLLSATCDYCHPRLVEDWNDSKHSNPTKNVSAADAQLNLTGNFTPAPIQCTICHNEHNATDRVVIINTTCTADSCHASYNRTTYVVTNNLTKHSYNLTQCKYCHLPQVLTVNTSTPFDTRSHTWDYTTQLVSSPGNERHEAVFNTLKNVTKTDGLTKASCDNCHGASQIPSVNFRTAYRLTKHYNASANNVSSNAATPYCTDCHRTANTTEAKLINESNTCRVGCHVNKNETHANNTGGADCVNCHFNNSNRLRTHNLYFANASEYNYSCSYCHTANSNRSIVTQINEWNGTAHNEREVGVPNSSGVRNPNSSFYRSINGTTGVVTLSTTKYNSCLKCHSPMDWNPAIAESSTATITLAANFSGISCSVCHNIHDMGDWLNNTGRSYAWYNRDAIQVSSIVYTANYTNVTDTTELCGNCHSNVRYGRTGPGWASTTSTTPLAPHGFPAKDMFLGSSKQSEQGFECIDCHMYKNTTYGNGTQLDSVKIAGHSFAVNETGLQSSSCGDDCHSGSDSRHATIPDRIEQTQTEIQGKWNTTNASVMAALDNYRNNPVNTSSRDNLSKAYWNLKLVSSDESWGVHNPALARTLLTDAATYANASNASLGQVTSSVDLVTGWNLVALNGTPSVTAPVDVLDSVSSNITVVWGYNTSASDPIDQWELYDPDMAEELNDLLTIVPGKGYWINAIRACKWTV